MSYIFRTCIADIAVILLFISVVHGEMTADVVYDALSNRLDSISFDIRLFRKDILEAESRIDGLERKIEELTREDQTRTEGRSSNLDQGDATTRLDKEIKRQAIMVHKMMVAEKKVLRDLEKQFGGELNDLIGVGQRINDINRSLEDVREQANDVQLSIVKQIDGFEQRLVSIKASVTNGQKGEQGEKGAIGNRGMPGRPGKHGSPGPSGSRGPKGDHGSGGSSNLKWWGGQDQPKAVSATYRFSAQGRDIMSHLKDALH